VKKLCILAVTLAVSAAAAPAVTCTTGTLSNYLSSSCTLGDKLFDNFSYTGNVAASNVSIGFEMVGTEFHIILAPVTGAGFFTTLSFTDRISVLPGVAPNIPPANYQIVGVKDQSNFSAVPGSAGLLNVANSSGPTFNLVPGSETGGPSFFAGTAAVTTVSTLTGPCGAGAANAGLASLELDYLQANTAVPEPATFSLIGLALVGAGLLLKRSMQS